MRNKLSAEFCDERFSRPGANFCCLSYAQQQGAGNDCLRQPLHAVETDRQFCSYHSNQRGKKASKNSQSSIMIEEAPCTNMV